MQHKSPLCEVFGFPINNISDQANHFRTSRLCPYNNISPNCTKDRIQDPLGVCSIYNNSGIAITCPIRFRQDWLIASNSASFFFPKGTKWTSLSEIRLNDGNGKSAGNIDLVLVAYDNDGRVTDFGAVEIQAVYISGNIRNPFQKYIDDMSPNFSWERGYNYPKADYLSSSRKRLVPQLMFKGGILTSWGKKMGVVIHESFYDTLPVLPEVGIESADIVWLIYGMDYDSQSKRYNLVLKRTVYTKFHEALNTLSLSVPGHIEDFIDRLQKKLDEKLEQQTSNESEITVINPISLFKED